MLARDFMTNRVVTVEMDDTLVAVRTIFDHTSFHHLLVVDGGRLCGILSDRDYLQHISPFIGTPAEHPRDLGTLNKRVHQIMQRHPETVTPETSLQDVVERFRLPEVTCLPVVDAEGRPVGIVTWRDLLRLMAKSVNPP